MISKFSFTFVFYLVLFNTTIFAQSIDFSEELRASIDTSLQLKLLASLDSLVLQIRTNNISENLLLQKESKLSKAIFEEVYSCEKSCQDASCKVSVALLNCYPIGKGRFLNQIAYYKQEENNSKVLQILLTVIAHRENGNITFSTPLNYYTETWKEEQIGSVTYRFREEVKVNRAKRFAEKNIQLAERCERPVQSLSYLLF